MVWGQINTILTSLSSNLRFSCLLKGAFPLVSARSSHKEPGGSLLPGQVHGREKREKPETKFKDTTPDSRVLHVTQGMTESWGRSRQTSKRSESKASSPSCTRLQSLMREEFVWILKEQDAFTLSKFLKTQLITHFTSKKSPVREEKERNSCHGNDVF